jgi:hypothetical protein
MMPFDAEHIDRIVDEFSSDELINLSDDLLHIAIELTLQDDLHISDISFDKGNELLVVIPKVIAARLNKAETFGRKFAELAKDDLVFVGYSLAELASIRTLLSDVIALLERRTQDDLAVLYHEVFEELKTSVSLDAESYRAALANVNEAYRIRSRHVMARAIDVYKQVRTYDFERFVREDLATVEGYRDQLSQAVELLEGSDVGEKFAGQLQGLRSTLVLVLEALNANTIGGGFARTRMSYIDDILFHIRHQPDDYIFEVIRRFARVSNDRVLHDYMKPEEIAIRYRTRYIKHNRVLLSLISNPIDVRQDFVLEVANNILKNLSTALNVKLQFIRTATICDTLITAGAQAAGPSAPYTQAELTDAYKHVGDVLTILENYTARSDYLETLQEKCYQAAILILEWFQDEFLLELAETLRRYQIYAARKLFTLRISTLCLVVSTTEPEELAHLASEKILRVCRDLIQYRYDFLTPSSAYLESRFDLETYRTPVLENIAHSIQHSRHRAAAPRDTLSKSGMEQHKKSMFSQMVIDSLALKVQELDDSPQTLRGDKSATKREVRMRISTSKERIAHFLKQYEEDRQAFLRHYHTDELMLP